MPYEKIGDEEPVCIADEVPFEIPESWEWVRIKNVGSIIRGSGIKRNEIVEHGFPCVRYGEIYTTYNTSFTTAVSYISPELYQKCKHFSHGDVLMTLTGENKPDIAKAVAYLGNCEVAAGGDLAFWTVHGMNPLFLSYLLASPYLIGRKVDLATGDIIVHISGDKIGSILVPIPPLMEQRRIVEKILELESYLTEYEQKENDLSQLQLLFPDTLKRSILQWAVQGKLVPQDQNDEPASVLLERIRAEKEQLIREGKIKRGKHESVIFRRDNSYYEKVDGIERCIDDEIPFDVPESWSWCRIFMLFSLQAGKNINASDLSDYKFPDSVPCYGGNGIRGFVQFANRCGDYPIIGRQGALCGNINRASGAFYATEHAVCVETYGGTNVSWACVFLEALNLNQYATATAQPGLAVSNVNNVLIPVSPIAEQKRIVEKIENILLMLKKL